MKKMYQKVGKLFGLDGCTHTIVINIETNCLKSISRVAANGCTQVQDQDYHEKTPPTPTSTPVTMIVAIANEKGLSGFHLGVSQAFVQVPLEEELYVRLPPGGGELSGKVVKVLESQYAVMQAGRKWHPS